MSHDKALYKSTDTLLHRLRCCLQDTLGCAKY